MATNAPGGVELAYLIRGVPFTPLCWGTADGFSEVVLYVSDALLAPYGFATSFCNTGARHRKLPQSVDGVVAFMRRLDPPPRSCIRRADPRIAARV